MEREKRYVPVIVRFDADGKLRPLEIEFDESHKYPVDKILDVRRAVPGGQDPGCPAGGLPERGRRWGPLHLHDSGQGNLPLDGERAMVRLCQAMSRERK